MRRAIALTMALVLMCFSMVALADESSSMSVVNCQSWVSLRSMPKTSSSQLARVPLGATVTDCSDAGNGFTRCTYDGQTGYILSRYLNGNSQAASGENNALADAMRVVNCQSWVSLRSMPKTSSSQLARVPLGATVTDCFEADNGFVRCTYNGHTGYILSRYLSKSSSAPEAQATAAPTLAPGTGSEMRIVNCQSWVSLRKIPSSSSEQLARVPLGATVTDCTDADNGFVRCVYNGQSGYILSRYLSASANAPVPTAAPTAAPETSTGVSMYVVNCQDWVSLRSMPSTSSSRLARVPLGAQVQDCAAASNGFTRCSYMGQTGYIRTSNLSTEAAQTEYGGIAEELSASGYRITIERAYDSYDEKIRVRCYSSSGTMLWEREASNGYATELTLTTAFIGGTSSAPRVMFYVASEGLSALNIRTGERIWLLSDSKVNLGGSICHAVADDGTMYIGGYYGPDPVAISADGYVLWQSNASEYDPYWLYEIELTDNGVLATYDMVGNNESGAQVLYGYDGTLLNYMPAR